MGRKRTKSLTLPEGMRERVWSSGKTYYYLETKGKTTPLGPNKLDALRKYCELMHIPDKPAFTFLEVVRRYQVEKLPTKATKTQTDELSRLKRLCEFFAEVPSIDDIEPRHLRMYQDWRLRTKASETAARVAEGKPPSRKGTGHVAINRELTLFSTIWDYAQKSDFTAKPCPASLVERFKERGRRDVYTEDQTLAAVYEQADQSLRDALDLAYLTGQRRADVLSLSESEIRTTNCMIEGEARTIRSIPITQEKTGNRMQMIVEGELETLINRIIERKRSADIKTPALLVTERGDRLTMQMLRGRFESARDRAAEANPAIADDIRNFQFRDLRAKAGSDKAEATGSMIEAQLLLGHAAASTTEIYVRQRRGKFVKPTK